MNTSEGENGNKIKNFNKKWGKPEVFNPDFLGALRIIFEGHCVFHSTPVFYLVMPKCDSPFLYASSAAYYAKRNIVKCADTGSVPPAFAVSVMGSAVPSGFLTDITVSLSVVVTIAEPTICEVPVALPTTV